jgi:putative pyoverdin transport system ATP-binding/permease protein
MNLVKFLWKSATGTFILAVVLSVIGGASSAALLGLIQMSLHPEPARIKLLASGFIALSVIICFTRIFSQLLLVAMAQKGMLNLVMELSRNILKARLCHVEKIGPPRLMAALTDDVNIVINGLTLVPASVLSMTVLLGCFAYMGFLSPLALSGVLLFIIIGAISFRTSVRHADRFLKFAHDDRNQLFDGFRSLIAGIKELKLNSRRKHSFLDFELDQRATSYRKHNLIATAIHSTTATWAILLFYVLLGLLLFVFPKVWHLNANIVTGYVLVLLFMIVPLDSLLNLLPGVSRASFTLGQLEILRRQLGMSIDALPDAIIQSASACDNLQLHDVCYRYEGNGEEEGFLVGPINLNIQRGQLIFIMGGNGSGKTTLAKILAGLYIPDSGSLVFNGQIIDGSNREYYRNHFAAVFNDFFLFKSILGIEDRHIDEHATSYLRTLQLDQKVTVKGGHLSSLDLSQGQRKRLALLVAYLEDRPIYLFDEWAADQDPVYKRFFYHEILKEMKQRNKTVLVITHDEQYFDIADRVIQLDSGQIVYDGIPYARLPISHPAEVRSV